jgi:uncharacterized glyoxalase superfamily protein PhnB
MPNTTPVLEAAIPILSVRDMSEALDYYERVLGFQPGWRVGNPTNLASVFRDRVELNLSTAASSEHSAGRVYFETAGVDSYYALVQAAGANVVVPLEDRRYGMRDFRVVDPSGNELSFGQSLA